MNAIDASPFHNVIKLVEKKEKQGTGIVYHSIAETTGKIDPKISWTQTTYLYRIQNQSAGCPEARGETPTIAVQAKAGGPTVNLAVSYRVVCPDGQEQKLVQAIGQYGSPKQALDQIITATIQPILWDHGDQIFAHMEVTKSELLKQVSRVVEEKTGLLFRGEIVVKDEDGLETLQVRRTIQVEFADLRELYDIQFQADLEVDSTKNLAALASVSKLGTLESRVIEWIAAYFKAHANAQHYAENFRQRQLLTELKEHLNEVLEDEGRVVTGLVIQALDPVPEPFLTIDLREDFQRFGNRPVGLESKVQLSLKDMAKFKVKCEDDIRTWAKRAFKGVIDRVCFRAEYTDFLPGEPWVEIERAIKDEMSSAAAEIGYGLDQIFSEPDIKELDYQTEKSRRFEIEDLQLKDQFGETVSISVAAKFAITDWADDAIARKVNQGIDLAEDIRGTIRDACADVLHQITPEDFFLKFRLPDDETETSVENALKSEVKKRIDAVYRTNTKTVVVEGKATELVEKINALIATPQATPVPVRSNVDQTKVIFNLRWRLTGPSSNPNSWNLVMRTAEAFEDLEKSLAGEVEANFALLDSQYLFIDTGAAVSVLLTIVNTTVREVIETSFGVVIEATNISRDETPRDAKIGDYEEKMLDDRIEEKTQVRQHGAKLLEVARKQELKIAEDRAVEFDSLNIRIREMEKEQDNGRFHTKADKEEYHKLLDQREALKQDMEATNLDKLEVPEGTDPDALLQQRYARTLPPPVAKLPEDPTKIDDKPEKPDSDV